MYFAASGIELSPIVPLAAAFAISVLTSMVGVSGAFLLVPFQISVLGISTLSISATNLLFNCLATPGGVWRFSREGRLDYRLARVVAAGTLPGLFAGWWIRTHWLSDAQRFRLFVGSVLLLLAIRMLMRRHVHMPDVDEARTSKAPTATVAALALAVGVVGGAYGIGGGALMAPVLVAFIGLPLHAVAGATLLATLVTSMVGVGLYSLVPGAGGVPAAPDWLLGMLFGLGGLAGTYTGARVQKFVPERFLRVGLAVLVASLAFIYLVPGLCKP